jgi:hypothetical protein
MPRMACWGRVELGFGGGRAVSKPITQLLSK